MRLELLPMVKHFQVWLINGLSAWTELCDRLGALLLLMFINPYLDGYIALPYKKHFSMFGFVPIDPKAITLIHVAAANFHLAH